MSHLRRNAIVSVLSVLAVVVVIGVAEAHEFWLMPSAPAWSATARGAQQDSADVVAVVTRYNAALAAADSNAALGLLAPDAIVLESGGAETVAEYRSHHLPADIAFAAGVATQRTPRRVQVRGDMAWMATTSVAQGEFRGRAVNSAGAELMVLTRTPAGWRISAIHWSSRARRPQ